MTKSEMQALGELDALFVSPAEAEKLLGDKPLAWLRRAFLVRLLARDEVRAHLAANRLFIYPYEKTRLADVAKRAGFRPVFTDYGHLCDWKEVV